MPLATASSVRIENKDIFRKLLGDGSGRGFKVHWDILEKIYLESDLLISQEPAPGSLLMEVDRIQRLGSSIINFFSPQCEECLVLK